ncbi:alpha/beta hydrolase [uncultured Microbacterium sp.]|uniref:alpha/beta hydrolase n=1 Tax=uncultured Microbacterium sp. TaxID=191216 RepID=UPI002627D7C5|nr:hypothetical protein [uncultured Microbacterium sp.]
MSTDFSPSALWPAERVRGTIALVTGRGERAPVYERFGRRLSADGYSVAVFEGDAEAAASWLGIVEGGVRVLAGSDAGASSVLRVLAQGATADAAIIAGLVVDLADAPDDAQRTACPLHLGVLATDAARSSHSVSDSLPDAADLAAIGVPVIAFQGGADPVSPFEEAVEALRAVPDLTLHETVDGLHDALNDASHRSVAATIVLWLERLRTGDPRALIVQPVPVGARSPEFTA